MNQNYTMRKSYKLLLNQEMDGSADPTQGHVHQHFAVLVVNYGLSNKIVFQLT